MLVFTSPALVGGSLEYALARKETNKYILVLARSYGMAPTREWAVLNSTTPASEQLVHSAENRPCIWVDADLDRDDRNLGPTGGVLAALLASDPTVVKVTGRKQQMYATAGGELEATEVVILLNEEELARFCCYCGILESVYDDFRFARCGGEGHASLYWCTTCSRKSNLGRLASSVWKKLW